jgi:hypothetical protein
MNQREEEQIFLMYATRKQRKAIRLLMVSARGAAMN